MRSGQNERATAENNQSAVLQCQDQDILEAWFEYSPVHLSELWQEVQSGFQYRFYWQELACHKQGGVRMNTIIKVIGMKKFRSNVVKETAYGIVDDYGEQDNVMTLQRVGDHLMIEWVVGDDLDYAEMGVYTVGKDVTELDGVFEAPKEAIQLLKECGFNTEEIE